jgi:hypothetical protein
MQTMSRDFGVGAFQCGLLAGILLLGAQAVEASVLTRFDVRERAGIARSDGVVEAGIPLARGSVASPPVLDLREEGGSLPVAFEPIAWWDDGSVRFVHARFPLVLGASETRSLSLETGSGLAYLPTAPALPALSLEIVVEGTLHAFPLSDGLDTSSADLRVRAWIDTLGANRVRVRVWMAQELEDASWSRVSLVVLSSGTPTLDSAGRGIGNATLAMAMPHAQNRGFSFEGDGSELRAHLYPDTGVTFAADEGFHVSAEAILEWGAAPDDLADRVDSPLRVGLDPVWLSDTGAFGSVAPGSFDPAAGAAAVASRSQLEGKQASNERNRGWVAYGDFFGRSKHEYLGYLLQEYGPASGLFLHALCNADGDTLDFALRMAEQYADAGLSLEGASFQHRSTAWALAGLVSRPAADALIVAWRSDPSTPLDDVAILAFATENLFASLAQEGIDETQETDAVRRERAVARFITMDRAGGALNSYKTELGANCGTSSTTPPTGGIGERVHALDTGTWARGCADTPEIADYARVHSQSAFFDEISFVSSVAEFDALAATFAARYGGDLSDEGFPGFNSWLHPNAQQGHGGGHMLLEQVAYGALTSPNPILLEFALLAAEYQSSDAFIDREVAIAEADIASTSEAVRVRRLGWPLLNLETALILTEGRDATLNAQVEAAIERLADTIIAAPYDRWKSLIHVAVGTEALARYVERTGDAAAAAKLVAVATYWSDSDNHWNSAESAFEMGPDDSQIIEALSVMFLHGLTRAAELSGDATLAARAEAVYASHGRATSGYAKTVGMLLRNVSRAQATGVLTATPAVPMLGAGALAALAAGLVGLGFAFARRGQRR